MDMIRRVEAAFAELENALWELASDATGRTEDRLTTLLRAVESLDRGFSTFAAQDERDDAYERS